VAGAAAAFGLAATGARCEASWQKMGALAAPSRLHMSIQGVHWDMSMSWHMTDSVPAWAASRRG
jgi:hypothetical protein